MNSSRAGGVLLHPTSLPGPFGIGDLGPEAHAFVDWLADSGCGLWQVLPIGPTGFGNSPYQCHSVFAGNPNLISPESLVEQGFLARQDIAIKRPPRMTDPQTRVNYAEAIGLKRELLGLAFKRFSASAEPAQLQALEEFRASNWEWLDDFSLYMALKERNGQRSWITWPARFRDRRAVSASLDDPELRESALRVAFEQMLFFRQWSELHAYANRRGVRIIGDVPIFAAEDSADVWAHPELFDLDDSGRAVTVAGVPPDYFAPTGQLWGNPLYKWQVHRRTGYAWWLSRLRKLLAIVDVVRIDHFRGLAAYWEVPASAPTAEAGRWVPGPGADFLEPVLEGLRDAGHSGPRIIAEDLGVVTPDVRELLDRFRLPGMRVFQFGLAGHSEDFLPHRYEPNCIAYTGTHDNDTARGWFGASPGADRDFALEYLGSTEAQVVKDMIRAVWGSAAMWAIAPMQDLLDLGPEARMNYPGRPEGNWEWRLAPGKLSEELGEWLRSLNLEVARTAA